MSSTASPTTVQGVIDTLSSYNPIDMFSQQPTRVLAALQALWRTPHNNLRLFVDGRCVPAVDAPAAVADALPEIVDAEAALLRVVAQVLTREGRLLHVIGCGCIVLRVQCADCPCTLLHCCRWKRTQYRQHARTPT